MPLISVIIPCRNEAAYVGPAIESLLFQEGVPGDVEILIADGMSSDGTREVLHDFENRFSQIKVFENHRKTVPFALQILLTQAQGEFIVRADTHCLYPSNYLRDLHKYLSSGSADNVGGVIETIPGADTPDAQVIANCMNSRFGVGVSFRTLAGNEPKRVETVPFGAWRKDHFANFGDFDQAFTRAQDLEHNIRVVKNGGTVLCLPWLKVRYYARDTFTKLWKMAFQYGYWKIPVMLKHRIRFSMRQFAPALLVAATVVGVLVGFAFPVGFLPVGIYALVNLIAAITVAHKDGMLKYFPLYSYAFVLMHYGYGFGYLRGLIDACFGRAAGFAEISR